MAGVDVLCFGGTKNGTAAGELVIFFKKELAAEFEYRAKQAGQLASKMRFLAAPWVGVLADDVWLENARYANRHAKMLAAKLTTEAGMSSGVSLRSECCFRENDRTGGPATPRFGLAFLQICRTRHLSIDVFLDGYVKRC